MVQKQSRNLKGFMKWKMGARDVDPFPAFGAEWEGRL
jgi:hypothetical protein